MKEKAKRWNGFQTDAHLIRRKKEGANIFNLLEFHDKFTDLGGNASFNFVLELNSGGR